MKEATFDPARRLDVYFRCNRAGSKDFTFSYSDGSQYSFIYEEFEFNIYKYEGEKKVYFPLTLSYSSNTLTASITNTQSNINQGQYYYELYNVGTEETWLCGYAYFHNGKFDGVSNDTSSVTIQENGEIINITLSVTPGTSIPGLNIPQPPIADSDGSDNTAKINEILVALRAAGIISITPWILAGGSWDDTGLWYDDSFWID